MEYFFENVIIGGGPAGSACGIFLKKAGAESCVIDKACFPRDKTCGGLVTEKTYQLIRHLFENENTDGIFSSVVSAISVYDRNDLLARAETKKGVRLVHRAVFDHALVQKYKALGGRVFEGETGYSIDWENRQIFLAGGDRICYSYLLFADGCLSQTHKLIDYDWSASSAFGIETILPAGSLPEDAIALHFGYLPDGYLWVFPYGDSIGVGAAGSVSKTTDYKRVLLDYLKECGIDPQEVRLQGAFLPYGGIVPQEKLPENILLLGDAGGFADPVSGEGLYFALETGRLAAQALCGSSPKAEYLEKTGQAVQIIRQGVSLRSYFYKAKTQKKFQKHIKGNEVFLQFFFDHQVSEYEYGYNRMLQFYRDYKKQKRK